MNKEEIEQEIKWLGSIKTHIEERLELLDEKAQLAEKPKLRHWDYGYVWDEGENEKPSKFIIIRHEKELWWSRWCALPSLNSLNVLEQYKYTILSNLADDLRALAEPVTKIPEIEIEIDDCGDLLIEDTEEKKIIFIRKNDIPEFIMNLRRLMLSKK